MARLGSFSPDLLPVAWFDEDTTANGWFGDDLIEAETTPPEPEPSEGGLTRRIIQLRRGR